MTELNKIRNEYYKLCTWKILKYVDEIWELAHNASLIFGDLPIIRKYEDLASAFRQKGLNDIAQAIKLLIREDNYESVPKLKKKEDD